MANLSNIKMVAETQNSSLSRAKTNKEDEFYTQREDVERELKHYRKHFKGKVVYLNCDDPRVSAFFHYFSYNFEKLGLKKLIATCYRNQNGDLFSENDSERAIYLEYTGDKDGDRIPGDDEINVNFLEGDGDFRSAEAIDLLKQADVAPLDVTGYGTLDERMAEGHDISDDERALIQRALDENSVIIAQMTPLFDDKPAH